MRKTQHRDRVDVCKHNRVIHNVVAQCPLAFDYEVMENVSDYNILSLVGEDFDLSDWQERGLDTHSGMAELDLAINPNDQSFSWSSPNDAALRVPRDELLNCDYFGRPYPGSDVPVGPFAEGWSQVRRRLRLLSH